MHIKAHTAQQHPSNNKTNKKVAFTFCSKFVSKRNSQQISKQ